jgi:hypothetical protein
MSTHARYANVWMVTSVVHTSRTVPAMTRQICLRGMCNINRRQVALVTAALCGIMLSHCYHLTMSSMTPIA